MSSLALSRLSSFNNSATTVVLAAANKLAPKPAVPMQSDDHSHDHMGLPNSFKPSNNFSLGKLLIGGNLKVTSSFSKSLQCRYSHTDIKIPDFSEYRNEYSESSTQHSRDRADDKKTFSYISTFGK
ncbi:Cytochrome b-c1 complex subunit mitochondrial [Brachionus plicatilis]|uniref:Cytochrome b-c1 complex subunit mitochondrial n=1 Tax=Brachionus plicatilis TaxID=10195 RepID=A0A3M7S833_BRAPC|nr:Cytochrome b-c1 complex subunit mitochondrial [Brachionus plicatilis]